MWTAAKSLPCCKIGSASTCCGQIKTTWTAVVSWRSFCRRSTKTCDLVANTRRTNCAKSWSTSCAWTSRLTWRSYNPIRQTRTRPGQRPGARSPCCECFSTSREKGKKRRLTAHETGFILLIILHSFVCSVSPQNAQKQQLTPIRPILTRSNAKSSPHWSNVRFKILTK